MKCPNCGSDCLNDASSAVPKGYAVVPKEPTTDMLDAGGNAMFVDVPRKTYCDIVRRGYKAMLAALSAEKGEKGNV